MSKKKNNILLVVLLIVVAGGMFAYQNFIMPAQLIAQKTVVFVAKKDIPADTQLKQDMFSAVEVTTDSVISGSIQDMADLEGKRLIGGVLKGEPIMAQRVSDLIDEEGTYYVKVEPDYPVDLREGEVVAVMQKTENTVETLFKRKNVYSSSQVTSILEGESVAGFYLLLTQEELEKYYLAKDNGGVIMTKIEVTTMSEKQANEATQPITETEKESE